MSQLIALVVFLWWLATLYRSIDFVLVRKFLKTSATLGVGYSVTWRILVAEYDQWIGCYIDRKNDASYWFPIPFIGVKFSLLAIDEHAAARASEKGDA